MALQWDKSQGVVWTDVESVGRYSIRREYKGSRRFMVKLNGKNVFLAKSLEKAKEFVTTLIDSLSTIEV